MWQSDEDFLKDLDQMDEICTSVIVNDETRSAFQARQTRTVTRNTKEKRSRLYSFSDEEDETPSKNHSLENLDSNDNLAEVGNQIRKATGNVYNNDVIAKYWQKSSENQAPQTEPQEITDRGHSLVFEPKYNFQQPIASANSSPMKVKPKSGKKESVASALANNLKTLKAKSVNKIESEGKAESVASVEAILTQPKVEREKVEPKGRCRISLPIASNNYKDYYSGAKITPPDLTKEYIPEDTTPITNTWDPWEQYSEQSFDQVSNSSLSSYKTSSDVSNGSRNKDFIDLNSKAEFPPL